MNPKGYETLIRSLLLRLGGYVSIPSAEIDQGSSTFFMRKGPDGATHLWLPEVHPSPPRRPSDPRRSQANSQE